MDEITDTPNHRDRQRREQDVTVLRAAWDAGKASGSAGPLNMADIIAEARLELMSAKRLTTLEP